MISVLLAIFISPSEKPVLHRRQQRVLVANGDTATLICDSDAIPAASVTWFKDNIQVQNPPSHQITKIVFIFFYFVILKDLALLLLYEVLFPCPC